MLLKLAALGAIGYVGYRYYQQTMQHRQTDTGETPNPSDPQVALAGGPLSTDAAVLHADQVPGQG